MSNKCVNKDPVHKYCRSKGNGYNGNTYKKSTNYIPEWLTNKYFISDNKYLKKATMT